MGTARLKMFLYINFLDFFKSLIETYSELIATETMNKGDLPSGGISSYV